MTSSADTAKPSFRIPFSVSAFGYGLAAGTVMFALGAGWVTGRSSDTRQLLQDKIPVKTIDIEHVAVAPKIMIPAAGMPGDILPLTPAPIDGLFETTPAGDIPIARASDGMTPFDAYKRPFTAQAGKGPVAIVFSGMGISAAITQQIITALPADITLSFIPAQKSGADMAASARAAGHEIWLTLPMQGDTYPNPDPGPNTILTSAHPEAAQGRLFATLADMAGYAGLTSPPNHAFMEADAGKSPVMGQIFGRGLAFVDTRIDRPFFAEKMATENAHPFAQANVWIKADTSPQNISARLTDIENRATADGGVIVFVEPTPLNIKSVAAWTQTLKDKPVQLAPLSALMKTGAPLPAEEKTDSAKSPPL